MKSVEELRKYYQKRILPFLQPLEKKRKAVVRGVILTCVFGGLATLAFLKQSTVLQD